MSSAQVEYAADHDQARRQQRRRAVEQILDQTHWLGEGEQALVEAVLRDGRSIASVGRAAGVDPRKLQRKYKKIIQRMRTPMFRYVAKNHDLLPRETQAVAKRFFLQGLTQRESAKACGLSLHRVRTLLLMVQTLQSTGR